MAKRNKAFSDAMAKVVQGMLGEGGGVAREAALRLKAAEPEMFAASRDESTLRDWTDFAASLFKRLAPSGPMPAQLVIPGMDMHRLPELPSAISIPSKEGGAPFFRTLSMATVGELRICVAAREKQLREDTTILDGLRSMLEHRVEQGAGDGDFVFEQPSPAPKRTRSAKPADVRPRRPGRRRVCDHDPQQQAGGLYRHT